MSYTYLLDLYNALETRIAEIDAALNNNSELSLEQQRLTGRRDCLVRLNSHLKDHYNQKLPRRMQQHREIN